MTAGPPLAGPPVRRAASPTSRVSSRQRVGVGEAVAGSFQRLGDGAPVLEMGVGRGRSVPTTNSWGFRPDAWLVRQDGSLTLTQFVAVVQTYRRIVQRRRGAAAAANA